MARFWPSFKRKQETVRDSDISIDEYFNFAGQSYPTNAFGNASGLYAFGGYPSDVSSGPKEEPMTDFVSYVNGAYKASGVVFACVQARMSLFTEARFAFQNFNGARPGDLVTGAGLELLQYPWPGGVSANLMARAIQDVDLAGNAYFIREGVPGNERLRRLRPDWVMLLLSGDPAQEAYSDLLAYVYKPGGSVDADKWEIYPVDGSNGLVAHWAPIPDPESCYRGMSWLTPVIKDISSDKAISQHKLKYFSNGAKPGMVVSYNPSVTPEQMREFTEIFNQTKLGVDNAYRPMFLGGGADVTAFNSSIETFKDVSSVGELRIASAAQVPPILIGLDSALRGSALNQGNFVASKDLFADSTIRPLWASFCAVLEPLIDVPVGARLWVDTRDIAFLREDALNLAQIQQSEAATLSSLVSAGFTPESSVKALRENDFGFLEHTGLYSVQLLEPGSGHAASFKGVEPATAIKAVTPKGA